VVSRKSEPAAVDVRSAGPGDVDRVAAIWHQGYRDGHEGNVPDEIFAYRQLSDFRARVPDLLPSTAVAVAGDRVVGFVMTDDDELYQLYVDPDARGSGAAAALLDRGEQVIGRSHHRAWLAVVAGNARARRFYERQGWRPVAEIEQPSYAGPGRQLPIAALRYEKQVSGAETDAGDDVLPDTS
jgi:ribosomal protein S18 acetylase RimI-like enzyme